MPPYIDIAPLSNRESNSAAHTGKGRMNAIGGLCLQKILGFFELPLFYPFTPIESKLKWSLLRLIIESFF